MSTEIETTVTDIEPVQGELLDAESSPLTLSLQDFVGEFGDELLDALNSAIDELRADGTLKELGEKYFGQDISSEN